MTHQYNKTLQSLRFIFVMTIFMSHFNYGDLPHYDADGDCGVAFFFLFSGFMLSMGYGQKFSDGTFDFKQFIKRRLLKIYPLHLLTLAIFLLLFRPEITHRLLLNALLLQSWIPDDSYYFSYNSVSWFLSTLLFSYILFPFLYRHANKFTLFVVLVYYVIAYFIIPYNMINELLYVSPLIRFVDFFLGIMLYKAYSRRSEIANANIVEVLLTILLIIAIIVYPFIDDKLRNAPLYWVVLLPFVYIFAQQQGIVSRCLQWKVLNWLGSLSMPIFIIHPIVFRIMIHFLPSIPSLLMLALCFCITITLSWGINRYIL